MWRNHHKEVNTYDAFFKYLKHVYPLIEPPSFKCPSVLFDTWNPDIPNTQNSDISVKENEMDQIFPNSDIINMKGNSNAALCHTDSDQDSENDCPIAPVDIDTPLPPKKKRRFVKERMCCPKSYTPCQ